MTTAIPQLPTELWARIASFTDRKSLKNLGLTCRALSMFAAREIFREIRLTACDQSCLRLERIRAQKQLMQYVNKISLDLQGWSPQLLEKHPELLQDWQDGADEDPIVSGRFIKLLESLKIFPNLRNVNVLFDPSCELEVDYGDSPQSVDFRESMMKLVLSSLTSLPQLPLALGLQNYQNVNPEDPETASMLKQVLGNLHSLRLGILNESCEGNGEYDLTYDQAHIFTRELPSVWLQPASSTLRHLTLYSTLYFGFYPKLDLQDIHFPNLQSLALGNYGFVHDTQLDWILSHGTTLQSLYMDDCAILYEVGIYNNNNSKDNCYLSALTEMYPDFGKRSHSGPKYRASYSKRWHDYFRAFQEGLPHLRHFQFGSSPSWWDDGGIPFEMEVEIQLRLNVERYFVFCDGYGPSPYMERWIDDDTVPYPTCDEEDMEAFKALLRKTGVWIESEAAFKRD
ncbi:hypothetical protein AJ78_04709 [Emergomyces pasteurianus Ep9510]|uniref:F-box domain-containing protein n=1 Tax=Emergomyces pasteurianus Ep9510 TaxID=1447872 RepID=A0A1J9Q465_9EURO|nr:hypothetical protein AJ78_04709 [Emergomyces pasteurianus Ep9510]